MMFGIEQHLLPKNREKSVMFQKIFHMLAARHSPEKNFHFLKNFCSYQNSRLLLPLFGAKNTCLLLVWAVLMHKIEEWITKKNFWGEKLNFNLIFALGILLHYLWGQYLKTPNCWRHLWTLQLWTCSLLPLKIEHHEFEEHHWGSKSIACLIKKTKLQQKQFCLVALYFHFSLYVMTAWDSKSVHFPECLFPSCKRCDTV